MKRLLLTLVLSIPLILLGILTQGVALSHESGTWITVIDYQAPPTLKAELQVWKGNSPAQEVIVKANAVAAKEHSPNSNPLLGPVVSRPEIGRAAPGDFFLSEGKPFVARRPIRTFAELGRAAPGDR